MSNMLVGTRTTAADGTYHFSGLMDGSYIVEFITPTGFTTSPQHQGGDPTHDSDPDPVTGLTNPITISMGNTVGHIDAGYFQVGPDIKLVKTHVGAFQIGKQATYKLTVTNDGNQPTVGPIVVTDPLPPQLTLVSATGNMWSCGASTPTVVSCTRNALLVPGQVAPVITIRVRVNPGTNSPLHNVATASTPNDIYEPNNTDDDVVNMVRPPHPVGAPIMSGAGLAGLVLVLAVGGMSALRRRRTKLNA
jgi:uncharacterized repeat protein (TIGR01451 family)